ncbi:MAG: hypothetical protein MJ211_08720 [Bacteroidales bacterium]|nr:hypothetical protein [Bacteroidales bacterium]
MKNFFLLICLALFSNYSFGQFESRMKEQKVVKGTVTVNGETKEGYISMPRMISSDGKELPCITDLQESFIFIDKTTFETVEKIKGKDKVKYTAKDCESFTYQDLVFESRKISLDLNPIPKTLFLLVQKKRDNATFYSVFSATSNVGNATTPFGLASFVVFINGSDKAKYVDQINPKKDFSNCSAILSKLDNKEYDEIRTAEQNFDLMGIKMATGDKGDSADGALDLDKLLGTGVDKLNRNLNVLDDYVNGKCE